MAREGNRSEAEWQGPPGDAGEWGVGLRVCGDRIDPVDAEWGLAGGGEFFLNGEMSDLAKMHSVLLEAVERRLEVVADHAWRDRDPAGHLEGLKAAGGRLDLLVRNLPADADPMLRHYLERQSYTKARDWLADAVG